MGCYLTEFTCLSHDVNMAIGVDDRAVYHELNLKLVWLVRIVNIITVFNAALAIIFCFVQVSHNGTYYLLVANLGISCLVLLVVNWWYKSGDLGSEKFWFLVLIGSVILLQCLSTDLFVFKSAPAGAPTTSPPPNSTIPFSWTTMMPATTIRPGN